MKRLEVSGAVRPLYGSLDVKGLITQHMVHIVVTTLYASFAEKVLHFDSGHLESKI